MKKKGRIPTIIGIVFLIFSIAAGVILVNNQQIFRLGASTEASPKNVRLSNISSSSFTISWLTDKETLSFVKWGKSENTLDKTEMDEIADNGFVHSTTIRNLQNNTSYFFKINAGGADFDNNGVVWEVKTGSVIQELLSGNFISGNVITPTGSPAKNALIYVTVGGSNLLSTITSQNGNWTISLATARSSDLTTPAQISAQSSLIEISINAGPVGVAMAQIYPQSARPTPPIIIGEVHDFKNLPPSPVSEIPNAQIGLPDISTESSGFTIDTANATPSSKTVTIDSVDNGEIITTTEPEFFGKGPSGITLTITVESKDPVIEQVKVASTGAWNWSPPKNLAEGTHKITIKWKDAAGILRTLTKTFVVQAAEGPAFVATPSGTPRGTTSPKPTAISSPTPISTRSAIPVSGSLTPTLLLSIMGIGVIAFALLLWQKAEIDN